MSNVGGESLLFFFGQEVRGNIGAAIAMDGLADQGWLNLRRVSIGRQG